MNQIFSRSLYTWKKTTLSWCLSIISNEKKRASQYFSCLFPFITDLLIYWFYSLKNLLLNSKENSFFSKALFASLQTENKILYTPPQHHVDYIFYKPEESQEKAPKLRDRYRASLMHSKPCFEGRKGRGGFWGKIRHHIY